MVKIRITVKNLTVYFEKDNPVLKDISLDIFANEILGIIGPASSGKTTFLRTLNRLNDIHSNFNMEGQVLLDGEDIYSKKNVGDLRKKVGMVFAMPNPLPISIFDNVAYGPKMAGNKNKKRLNELVERSLKASYLFDEVKDRLHKSALELSGGQQQRLCIARTLANEPEVILFDEPCSGLDPISTTKVEDAMHRLKEKYTLVLVTNNTKQAARVCDRTAFFLSGELIEVDKTATIFTVPKDKRTGDYMTGRFG